MSIAPGDVRAAYMQRWRDNNRDHYNAYMRHRRAQIKAGNWQPHRLTAQGQGELTDYDLGWVVGIVEGEGNFSPSHYSMRIRVDSTDREIPERLLALLGGGMRHRPGASDRHKDVFTWTMNGKAAEVVIDSLYDYLSPRRQDQILSACVKTRRFE